MRADLVVIGGGLIGLASACEARRAGLSVLLLERDACGSHASSATAGGVRSLNRHPAEIPLARAALPLWAGLSERLGTDVGFVVSGQVRVAEDAASLAALEARVGRVRAAGWTHERLVSGRALFDRLPALARHCPGGLVVDDDGFADPLKTLHAYRAACVALGVRIRERVDVRSVIRAGAEGLIVTTDAGEVRAGLAVNCAGAWAMLDRGDGPLAGLRIPMRASALQMIVTTPVAPFVEPVVGSHGHKLSLKQTAAGAVVIGGAFEGRLVRDATGVVRRGLVEPARVAANLANAVRLFPQLGDAQVLRSWAGVEGMVEDGLPVIGESRRVPGYFQAFGFSAHGFALAPVIGHIVHHWVIGRQSHLSLGPFTPERFSVAKRQKEAADASA